LLGTNCYLSKLLIDLEILSYFLVKISIFSIICIFVYKYSLLNLSFYELLSLHEIFNLFNRSHYHHHQDIMYKFCQFMNIYAIFDFLLA